MKRLSILTALAVTLLSGYIGFTTNYTNTAKASEIPTIPRFVDIPRTNGIDLNIDLKSEKVQLCEHSDEGINVNIQKKDSIVYRTRTKTLVVKEEVKVPIYVTPPTAFVSNRFEKPSMDRPERINILTIKN